MINLNDYIVDFGFPPCLPWHTLFSFSHSQIPHATWVPRQENLLRKYLSYTEPSRAAVSVADLTMAITRDVPELIHEGFMSLHRTQHESFGVNPVSGGKNVTAFVGCIIKADVRAADAAYQRHSLYTPRQT